MILIPFYFPLTSTPASDKEVNTSLPTLKDNSEQSTNAASSEQQSHTINLSPNEPRRQATLLASRSTQGRAYLSPVVSPKTGASSVRSATWHSESLHVSSDRLRAIIGLESREHFSPTPHPSTVDKISAAKTDIELEETIRRERIQRKEISADEEEIRRAVRDELATSRRTLEDAMKSAKSAEFHESQQVGIALMEARSILPTQFMFSQGLQLYCQKSGVELIKKAFRHLVSASWAAHTMRGLISID